jgi:hypothetical protein
MAPIGGSFPNSRHSEIDPVPVMPHLLLAVLPGMSQHAEKQAAKQVSELRRHP